MRTPFDDDSAYLPLDPDVEVEQEAEAGSRPVHLRPLSLALVFAGGTVGVAIREALVLAVPTAGGIPWTLLGINISGAFLLGVLLEMFVRRGPDHDRRRTLRLLLGTGVMGGYTSYSAIAADAANLMGSGAVAAGIGYGLATVLLGGVATWAGVVLATLAHRGRIEVAP